MANNSTPFQDAMRQMSLTPQEQNLYMHHLNNLLGPGKVPQPSGSIASVYQAVIPGPGGRFYNVPTVWNGKILDTYSAAQMAAQSGWQNWPSYRTPDEADLRYERMHDFMQRDTESYQQATTPIKSFKRGGQVKKTGVYKLHKGEKVVPAKVAKKSPKVAAKVAVHAHERKMHPGKPLTKLPGGRKPGAKRR